MVIKQKLINEGSIGLVWKKMEMIFWHVVCYTDWQAKRRWRNVNDGDVS